MTILLKSIAVALLAAGAFLLTHRIVPRVLLRCGRALGWDPRLSPVWEKRIGRFRSIRVQSL